MGSSLYILLAVRAKEKLERDNTAIGFLQCQDRRNSPHFVQSSLILQRNTESGYACYFSWYATGIVLLSGRKGVSGWCSVIVLQVQGSVCSVAVFSPAWTNRHRTGKDTTSDSTCQRRRDRHLQTNYCNSQLFASGLTMDSSPLKRGRIVCVEKTRLALAKLHRHVLTVEDCRSSIPIFCCLNGGAVNWWTRATVGFRLVLQIQLLSLRRWHRKALAHLLWKMAMAGWS